MSKIQLRVYNVLMLFVFYLIDHVIIPTFVSKIPTLRPWKWMANEARDISVELEREIGNG